MLSAIGLSDLNLNSVSLPPVGPVSLKQFAAHLKSDRRHPLAWAVPQPAPGLRSRSPEEFFDGAGDGGGGRRAVGSRQQQYQHDPNEDARQS
jgi:hypothetical protein